MEVNEPMLKFVHWINHNICNKWRTIHDRLQQLFCAYLVWICWWRILFARWWHDDAVRILFCASLVPLYFIVSTLHANANLPTIWYSHKLFVFRMAMKKKWYRVGDGDRPGREENKRKKNQYTEKCCGKTAQVGTGEKVRRRATHRDSVLFRTHLSISICYCCWCVLETSLQS